MERYRAGGDEGIAFDEDHNDTEALRAWREALRLDVARAVVWARTCRHAPPWPGRDAFDRHFRDAWLALEREAATAQKGWEPDLADPCDPSSSPEIADYAQDEVEAKSAPRLPLLSPDDRSKLSAWLGRGSPMAMRVLAWICERPPARRLGDRGGKR